MAPLNLRRTIVGAVALVAATLAVVTTSSLVTASSTSFSKESVAVIVHSYTGSNATIGREIARMLNGSFVVYHDRPPMPGARTIEPVLADIDLVNATRDAGHIFIGFPIWGQAPTPAAFEAVRKMDLRERRVTFFFSHIHYADPAAIARLRREVEMRGGVTNEPLPFLLPVVISDEGRRSAARAAILGRPDLWPGRDARPARPACATRNETSGSTLCSVPSGYAWLGGTEQADDDPGARPATRVHVNAFEIDRSEVTVAQWRKCAAAGACPEISLSDDPCRVLGTINERDPMPCVAMEDARTYCRWAGMRVPTEAEWTRAARGDSASPYPWGNADPRAGAPRGNFGQAPGRGLSTYELAPADGSWPADPFKGLAPACSFPRGNSPFGVCDLSGNLNEWIESDLCGDASSSNAMLKGGSWLDANVTALRVGSHGCFNKELGWYLSGFRCAR